MKSLCSDIGGQLGLFVGISALTVTEFLELLITLLTMWFNKRKARTENLRHEKSTNDYSNNNSTFSEERL